MPHPKVPQEISNPVNDNIQKLASLFPSAVKDGELDLEALKQELGQFTEVGTEKYELTWAGKQEAKQTAFTPILGKTLKYIPEESKNPDTTQNLYIEGDNLEVLKLLRQNYYGAVKMIYIDPPYNTGNDFIYNDNFRMTKEENDIAEGDMSELGERYTVNRKDHNRYHTNWLNMMYPRLRVAKDLLRDDGVIFISIDDGEVADLRKICDEVFGDTNFVANIVWQKKYGPANDAKGISQTHEHLLVYGKNIENWNPGLLPRKDEQLKAFKNPDNDSRGVWRASDLSARTYNKNSDYKIIGPNGDIFLPPPSRAWIVNESKYKELLADNRITFGSDGLGRPMQKKFLSEVKNGITPETWWGRDKVGDNKIARYEIKKIFPENVFDTPKPSKLISYIGRISNLTNEDIILDFFSGSATTAHAVMQLNAEDNSNRKYIMVQLPETCPENSEAFKAGYKNICEIGKERIRRAGQKILEENKEKEGIENLDVGFKVFRVGDTNINWLHQDLRDADLFDHYNANASDKDKLDFTPGFTDLDVVYEIMLRQTDIPLSCKVEQLTRIGERIYIFADSFLVCLEQTITRELVDRLAAIEPLPVKFVFRDSAFDDDIALKDETCRMLSALIERNSGGEKQTYTVEFI